MTEQEFTQLLEDIRNQVITTEELAILVRNSSGDLINEDTIIIDDEKAILLVEALKYNSYIIHLDLSFNDIGDEGAIALAGLNTLKSLKLAGNWIKLTGGIALVKSNLEYLSLEANSLHNDSNYENKVELIDALINNHTIKDLSFECCLFSDELINKLIKENNTLTILGLSQNNLTDAAIQSISINHTLKELHLSDNNITNVGIDYILGNTYLSYINLAHTNITMDGAKKFIGSHFDRVGVFNNSLSMNEINIFEYDFELAKQQRLLLQQQQQENLNLQNQLFQDDQSTDITGNIDHNEDEF